jgi:hypothetical protein
MKNNRLLGAFAAHTVSADAMASNSMWIVPRPFLESRQGKTVSWKLCWTPSCCGLKSSPNANPRNDLC